MNCALILSFCYQTNLKIIWKFSLSQYRCHKTPKDVENCVKSTLNSNHKKNKILRSWRLPIEERACRKTDLGGGDYYLRNSGMALPRLTWGPLKLRQQCLLSLNGALIFKSKYKIKLTWTVRSSLLLMKNTISLNF